MKYLIIILLFLSACTKPQPEDVAPPTIAPLAPVYEFRIETLANYNRVWIDSIQVYNSELGLNVKWTKTVSLTEGDSINITVGDLSWDQHQLTIYAQDTVYYFEYRTGPINYTLK